MNEKAVMKQEPQALIRLERKDLEVMGHKDGSNGSCPTLCRARLKRR